ncbi:DUF3375 family protein [Chitinimonas arctica]|uniref:DUF3375 family protein n=1 Tax=Chitinimonas arctica TaxID=2594795 RepID=UPI00357146AA
MTLDFSTLEVLRTHNPAWRLLRSDHAPLVASFLHRVFVAPNVRGKAAADLAEALEDELYALRLQLGEKGETAFPKPALEYLNDWAAPDRRGWRTAASWTSCMASRARRWPCASRRHRAM